MHRFIPDLFSHLQELKKPTVGYCQLHMHDSIKMIILTLQFLFSSDFKIEKKVISVNKIVFVTLNPVGNREYALS